MNNNLKLKQLYDLKGSMYNRITKGVTEVTTPLKDLNFV